MNSLHLRTVLLCMACMSVGFYAGLNYDHEYVRQRIPVRITGYFGIRPSLRQGINVTGSRKSDCKGHECNQTDLNVEQESSCSTAHDAILARKLLAVQKMIVTAHRHARSGITIKSLIDAFLYTEEIQNIIEMGRNLTNQSSVSMTNNQYLFPYIKVPSDENLTFDVCPEKFMGMRYGYPYYYTGFVIENCTWAKPVSKILTMILDFTDTDSETVKKVVPKIHEIYPETKLVILHNNSTELKTLNFSKVLQVQKLDSKAMQDAISQVDTKYTFIAQNLVHFSKDAKLERLIRMVDFIDVDVAAGSHRNESGHWKIDCYQTKMRNFEFRLVEGYDLSYNSCIYCDYAGGPFLAKTQFLKENPFSASLESDLMFVDFFYKIFQKNATVINCPDALFFTKSISRLAELSKSQWTGFVKHWQLSTIRLPSKTIEFSCSDVGHKCTWPAKGMTNMPCCLKYLSDMLKFFMREADSQGVKAEIEAGTNVGAIKFYGTLPWELDADLNYLSTHGNQEKLLALVSKFRKTGYTLQQTATVTKCKNEIKENNPNCGYFALRSHGWRIECWGSTFLAGRQLDELNITHTKVLIDGDWLRAYPNPADSARNMYGDDMYKHVEHWIHLGFKTGWIPYTPGSFLKCPKPGSHACLDQYLPVGNLQFQQVWL